MTTGDRRSIPCPHCGAALAQPLAGRKVPEPGRVHAHTAECPACGRRVFVTAEWTLVVRAETFAEVGT